MFAQLRISLICYTLVFLVFSQYHIEKKIELEHPSLESFHGLG